MASAKKPAYEAGAANGGASEGANDPVERARSDLDAMGKDKRRHVMGGTYGPTRTRIFATFATTFAIIGALAIGFYLAAKELDKPPETNAVEAPWAAPDAPQRPPRELQ